MRQLLIVSLVVAAPAMAGEVTMRNCNEAVENQWSTFRRVPVEGELLRIKNQYKYDPAVAIGDFDGDSKKDYAFLLEQRGSKGTKAIAVCLSSKGVKVPVLITNLYVDGTIHVTAKGTEYYDFEARKEGKYKTDGITISCCECCGATYIYANGQFEQIIDGD